MRWKLRFSPVFKGRKHKVSVFLSHDCGNHGITYAVRDGLVQLGYTVIVDPFNPGDETCDKAQKSIKESTHFILLLTPNASFSRWVQIEVLFAKLCYKGDAICLIPVSINEGVKYELTDEFIHLKWEDSEEVSSLVSALSRIIDSNHPTARLRTDERLSESLTRQGRQLERQQAETGNYSFLHQAVDVYEEAIRQSLCNHHAWANLAWSLWKLREDNVAREYIRIAKELSPFSRHVKDVDLRMEEGRRSII